MKKLSIWLLALTCSMPSLHASEIVPAVTGVAHSAQASRMLGNLKLAFYQSRDGDISTKCAEPSTVERLFSARNAARSAANSDFTRVSSFSSAIHIAAECGLRSGAGSRWLEDITYDVLGYYRVRGALPYGFSETDLYAIGTLFGGYDDVKKVLEARRIFDPAAANREDKTAEAPVYSGPANSFLEQKHSGNRLAFDSKYEGKVVELNGKISAVHRAKDGKNQEFAFVSIRHSRRNHWSVSCSTYDSSEMEKFKAIEPNKKIYKVKGLVRIHAIWGVSLEKCSIR